MQEVVIRPYRQEDLPFLIAIGEQIVQDGTLFPFRDVQGVKEYWFSKGGHIFVAQLGENVVGSYVLKPIMPDRCAHIANAGYMVDEQFRRRGIGYVLGQDSIQRAVALGFRGMQFNVVVSTNASAIRLWKRLGFAHVGTIPAAFQQDRGYVDLLIWHRSLETESVRNMVNESDHVQTLL